MRNFITSSNHQVGGPPFVGWLWLFIKYICSYLPYVEAVSYKCNLRNLDALVTGFLYYGTNPLTKCSSPGGFFAQSLKISVIIPLIHSPTHNLCHHPTHPFTISVIIPLIYISTHNLCHHPTHPLTISVIIPPSHPLTISVIIPLIHSQSISLTHPLSS